MKILQRFRNLLRALTDPPTADELEQEEREEEYFRACERRDRAYRRLPTAPTVEIVIPDDLRTRN